jgi:hypothetical protein
MYERVSQGRRIVGFTLDWLASYAIALGLFGGAGDLASKLDRSRGLTILIVALEYFGHRLVGLKVIQYIDGSKPTFMQALVRTALLVVVITAITFDENGRGINERLSHTALARS